MEQIRKALQRQAMKNTAIKGNRNVRPSKVIKKIAKQEGISVEQVKAEMQAALNGADWSSIYPDQKKPSNLSEALLVFAEATKKEI